MWSPSRLLWLSGTALAAYVAGVGSAIVCHDSSWGTTPLRDFLILGAIYIGLVAPATYATLWAVRRGLGLKISTGNEGPLFVILIAVHGLPAGAVLGLGYGMFE